MPSLVCSGLLAAYFIIMNKIKLGSKAKDKVTGFEGIVTAEVNYLTGCAQYCLVPPISSDGKIPDSHYFDGARLEVLQEDAVVPETVQENGNPGGPNRDCPR